MAARNTVAKGKIAVLKGIELLLCNPLACCNRAAS